MENKNFVCLIIHEDGKFSAIEQIYHPTPSGCDRWLDGLCDNRKWNTEKEAIDEYVKVLNGYLIECGADMALYSRVKFLVEYCKKYGECDEL